MQSRSYSTLTGTPVFSLIGTLWKKSPFSTPNLWLQQTIFSMHEHPGLEVKNAAGEPNGSMSTIEPFNFLKLLKIYTPLCKLTFFDFLYKRNTLGHFNASRIIDQLNFLIRLQLVTFWHQSR